MGNNQAHEKERIMSYYGIGVVNTECPFYIREAEKEITCEGVVTGTKATTKFESRSDKENFQKQTCFHGCERCYIAKELEKKYAI